MAIWDFAKPEVLLRLIGTFAVIGIGTYVFSVVNGLFGQDNDSARE
ncbi:MAG: hypothetical protein HC906_03525 [Bacteroidales bacterium]|nr:hypothetical protein [Bacteroidales bacterium]